MGVVSLRDLRITALPGPALRIGLDHLGPWIDVAAARAADGADVVIVDTAGLRAAGPGREADLIQHATRWAHAAGAPTVLWSTAPAGLDQPLLDLADRFDAVAAADPEMTALVTAGRRRPARVPWGAVHVDVDAAPIPLEHRAPIAAFVGAWSTRNRGAAKWLGAVLAAIGLERIEVVAWPELTGGGAAAAEPWPQELAPAVRGAGAGAGIALLRRARVVIWADPTHGSPDFVAPGYLQAMASGGALVSHRGRTLSDHFLRAPALLANPRDERLEQTLQALVCGSDDAAQTRARAGVALAVGQHAIAHRLASLASLVGVRALVD